MSFTDLERIPVDRARARVYCEGWQSWSPTTYRFGEPAIQPKSEGNRRSGYGGTRPAAPAGGYQGEGLLVLDPGTGEPVVTVSALRPDEIPVIRVRPDGDAVVLSADGPVAVDRSSATIGAALAAFGDRFARVAGAGRPRQAPTIWCSWYHYFSDVSDTDMAENIAAIDRLDLAVDVVQLDDGYQAEIGDWLTLSGRFTALSDIVARVSDTGRRTGIWIAPFLAGARSDVATDHPEWLLQRDGKPLIATENWQQDIYALDTTAPGVQDHFRKVFGFLRGLGIDLFKIDFIYAGALNGRRHADLPSLVAYRDALDVIRESIGGAYLLGCGAPILPTVGKVDAMRISPDTAPQWEPSGGDLAKPGGRAAVLTGAARAWQHGRFWVNDPDCFLLRPAVERREQLAEHARRFGGLRGSSDPIADLDCWGLAATRELLTTVPLPVPFGTGSEPGFASTPQQRSGARRAGNTA